MRGVSCLGCHIPGIRAAGCGRGGRSRSIGAGAKVYWENLRAREAAVLEEEEWACLVDALRGGEVEPVHNGDELCGEEWCHA